MKKFIAVLIVLLLCMSLFASCSKESEWTNSGFTFIGQRGNVQYLYHNDTKVIYVFFEEAFGYSGGMSALLNQDGTPMLWEA